jgi:hypothetical protein
MKNFILTIVAYFKSNPKEIVFIARLLISALFLLSAITKLWGEGSEAIVNFEKNQLIPMGFSSDIAPIFSRLIIGFEFFIAFAILQSNYIKKLVIPSTVILLTIFTIDLSIDFFSGNSENCGCFGDVIPMSPVQAIFKNIITLFILYYLYMNVKDKKSSNFLLLLNGFLIIALLMFSLLPIASPNKQISSFTDYVEVDINEGKKILCFFDPGCSHCMDAAKSLNDLSLLYKDFPKVHIIFSDTEVDKIPEFLEYSGSAFSNQVMEFYNDDTLINSYLELRGYEYENPVVIYYNNGNQMRFYDGYNSNKYDHEEFKKLFELKQD